MKKFGVVFLIAVFFVQMTTSSYAESKLKKYALEAVKYELHDELNKRLGTDIPVENVLQALDYISYGEFDKAKQVIDEEAASQVLGILVGSAGASAIGVAWNFAKSVYNEMIKYNEKTDILHFKRDFLNEQIKSWKVRKSVPSWKEFNAMVDAWFDDRIGNTEIGRSVPYGYRKEYYEQLRSKIWAEALKIHTRYKRYFYVIHKAQLAAKRAKEEINWKVSQLAIHYDIVSWRLEGAKEPVNKETLKRYDNDATYRRLVNIVYAINKSLPKGKEININAYISLVKKLHKASSKSVLKAYAALAAAEIPTTKQNIRLFIMDAKFRNSVMKEASRKKAEMKRILNNDETYKRSEELYSNMTDVESVEFLELVNSSDKNISQKVKTVIKNTNEKTYRVIKRIWDSGHKVKVSQTIFLTPYINLERDLANGYLNESISFSNFIAYSKVLFENAVRYYYSVGEKTQLDEKNWKDFKAKFKDILNMVAQKRAEAAQELENRKRIICQKDDVLEFIGKTLKRISKNKKLTDKDIFLINSGIEEFEDIKKMNYKTVKSNELEKEIELFSKLKEKAKADT